MLLVKKKYLAEFLRGKKIWGSLKIKSCRAGRIKKNN